VTDSDDPKPTRPHEQSETEQKSSDTEEQRLALAKLANQLSSLVDEIKTDREAETAERHNDRYWQRVLAVVHHDSFQRISCGRLADWFAGCAPRLKRPVIFHRKPAMAGQAHIGPRWCDADFDDAKVEHDCS
jgi:hypothetical protein